MVFVVAFFILASLNASMILLMVSLRHASLTALSVLSFLIMDSKQGRVPLSHSLFDQMVFVVIDIDA